MVQFRSNRSNILFKLVLLGTLMLYVSTKYFSKYGQTKILPVLQTERAGSVIHCCSICKTDKRCQSVSYNDATNECLLTAISSSDISGNAITDANWATYYINEWLLVFRAVAGRGCKISAWLNDSISSQSDVSCKYPDEMSCLYYRASTVDKWTSIAHDKIKYALHKKGEEVVYIIFNGTRSVTLSDWFKPENILNSSWPDLQQTSFVVFKMNAEVEPADYMTISISV